MMCIFDVAGKWPCGGPPCKLKGPVDWKLGGANILQIIRNTNKIQTNYKYILLKLKQYNTILHCTHPGGYCMLFGCWSWCILLSSGRWGCWGNVWIGTLWFTDGIDGPGMGNWCGGRVWECGTFCWKACRSWGGCWEGKVPAEVKWGCPTATGWWWSGMFGGREPLYIWNVHNM